MTNQIWYTEIEHLQYTLDKGITQSKKGAVKVVETDVVVDGIRREELRQRNIEDRLDYICTIRWDHFEAPTMFAHVEICFHESQVEHPFQFTGSPGGWTALSELSMELGDVERILLEDMNSTVPWFAEIDTGSMATHGTDGGADREFKYETSIPVASLKFDGREG